MCLTPETPELDIHIRKFTNKNLHVRKCWHIWSWCVCFSLGVLHLLTNYPYLITIICHLGLDFVIITLFRRWIPNKNGLCFLWLWASPLSLLVKSRWTFEVPADGTNEQADPTGARIISLHRAPNAVRVKHEPANWKYLICVFLHLSIIVSGGHYLNKSSP